MPTSTDLPIIVLAAGQSSRMRGRDKLLETVDGSPLVRRQTEIASQVTSGPVIVALPPSPHPRYAALEDLNATLLPVDKAHQGLSESLKAALNALPSETKATMIFLADLPELTVQDLATVASAVDAQGDHLIWRGTTSDGAPGHPIVISSQLFAEMKQITGDTGGADVMKRYRDRTVFVPLPEGHALCDLDTPEDWDNWRAARAKRS